MSPEEAYKKGVAHAVKGLSLSVDHCRAFHQKLVVAVEGVKNPAGRFIELKKAFEKGYNDTLSNQKVYGGEDVL